MKEHTFSELGFYYAHVADRTTSPLFGSLNAATSAGHPATRQFICLIFCREYVGMQLQEVKGPIPVDADLAHHIYLWHHDLRKSIAQGQSETTAFKTQHGKLVKESETHFSCIFQREPKTSINIFTDVSGIIQLIACLGNEVLSPVNLSFADYETLIEGKVRH
jgi:hypothetical protein